MSEATPRVLAPHLQQFQHQTVRLLGKVTQLRGDTGVLDAGGLVTILLNRVSPSFRFLLLGQWDISIRSEGDGEDEAG